MRIFIFFQKILLHSPPKSIFQFLFIRILFFFNPLPLILPLEVPCSFSTRYCVDRFWNAAYHPTHGSRSEIAQFSCQFCRSGVRFGMLELFTGWAADTQVVPRETNAPLSRFQSNNGLILCHSTFNRRNRRARPLNSSCSLGAENRGSTKAAR